MNPAETPSLNPPAEFVQVFRRRLADRTPPTQRFFEHFGRRLTADATLARCSRTTWAAAAVPAPVQGDVGFAGRGRALGVRLRTAS